MGETYINDNYKLIVDKPITLNKNIIKRNTLNVFQRDKLLDVVNLGDNLIEYSYRSELPESETNIKMTSNDDIIESVVYSIG